MSAFEPNTLEVTQSSSKSSLRAPRVVFEGGDPIQVVVDAEWRILQGTEQLAAILDLDEEEMGASSIGRLLHPDDIAISPTAIARRSAPTSLRFRHGRHGFVRLDTRICSMGDGWRLSLCETEAKVLTFPT